MEKKELGLVGAAPLSTEGGMMRIQKGDMLRESATRKVWKVVAAYRRYEDGEYFVECEDMEPGAYGVIRVMPLKSLSLMMG